MHYEGNIIRPPSEANSILIQVTVGCSRNKCTFCGTYKGERFKIKPVEVVMDDIDFASRHCKRQDRLFLCDGDALIISQSKLLKIMHKIRKKLPWVKRIGIYANAKSLETKTIEELKQLKAYGLGIVYVGLETGDDSTLKSIRKGTTSSHTVEVCQKIKLANIKLSLTILLGIAGRERSLIHAKRTGDTLSNIDPEYVGALSLILIPGTPIYDEYKSGKFELLEAHEMLKELRVIIENTNLSNGLFHANHASNYLPIRATMPDDKEIVLKAIDAALLGKSTLKPEWMRAL